MVFRSSRSSRPDKRTHELTTAPAATSSSDQSSDPRRLGRPGTDRHRVGHKRERLNTLTLTGTAYSEFVNHRSWVRVPPSAQKNRGLRVFARDLTSVVTAKGPENCVTVGRSSV